MHPPSATPVFHADSRQQIAADCTDTDRVGVGLLPRSLKEICALPHRRRCNYVLALLWTTPSRKGKPRGEKLGIRNTQVAADTQQQQQQTQQKSPTAETIHYLAQRWSMDWPRVRRLSWRLLPDSSQWETETKFSK